jgi:hypothetical protein
MATAAKVPAYVRVQAAGRILELAHRIVELEEVQAEIEALKERVGIE